MRKSFTILLLLLFTINMAGPYCLYLYRQQATRMAMKAVIRKSLSEDQLTKIDLQQRQPEIHWEEPGKEFMLKGEMYDVVKIVRQESRTVAYCVMDRKEKELMQAYENAAANKKTESKQGFKFQQVDLFCSSQPLLPLLSSLLPPQVKIGNSPLASCLLDIVGPPPRC